MDESILRAVNAWTENPTLAAFALFLSSPWMLFVTTVPLATYLFTKKRYVAIISITLAMASADAINARIIKPIIARERPCRQLDELYVTEKCGVGKSFVSGHAATSFAFAVTAAPTIRFGWMIFPLTAFLVACSRVALGVHYPTDIAAGAIFGGTIGGLFVYGRMRVEALKNPNRRRPDPPATNAPNVPPL